jgi:anti-sigma factor RsiW
LKVKYDEETLMAYADGELDEETRAEITAAVEQDPELARRVAQQRALRAQVAGAYSDVLDQPVPDRLRAAARGPLGNEAQATQVQARETRPRGNVVQFPARGARAPGAPWRAREWTAIAASLVLGGVISWQFMSRSMGDIASRGGVLLASGELARAFLPTARRCASGSASEPRTAATAAASSRAAHPRLAWPAVMERSGASRPPTRWILPEPVCGRHRHPR